MFTTKIRRLAITLLIMCMLRVGFMPNFAQAQSLGEVSRTIGSLDQPELVADLSGNMRQVAVSGSYAYIAEQRGDTTTLGVYDTTAALNQVGSITLPGASTAMAQSGTIIYIVTAKYSSYPVVSLIDISNPLKPQLRGSYTVAVSYTLRIIIPVNNRLYLGGDELGDVLILNVSNPDSPAYVGVFGVYESELLTVSGNRIAVGGRGRLIEIFDISNPDHPTKVTQLNITGKSGILIGNLLYSEFAGIWSITDITKPADQALLGTYTFKASDSLLRVAGTRIYGLTPEDGLTIFDISNPAVIRHIGAFGVEGVPSDVAIAGGQAYVVGTFGMRRIDVGSLVRPRFRSGFEFPSPGGTSITGIQIVNHYAYVTLRVISAQNVVSGQLVIIDISNPSAPVVRASYGALTYPTGIAVTGNIAYVADGFRIEIIDISNLNRLQRVGEMRMSAQGVRVIGTRAYVTGLGITILDISVPSKPRILSRITSNFGSTDIDVVGDFAYVSAYNGLSIYNIANPSAPVLLSTTLPDQFQPGSLRVKNAIAYSASNVLTRFDVNNPSAPILLDKYGPPQPFKDLQIAGDTAYLAGDKGGLQIFQLGNAFSPRLSLVYENSFYVERLAVDGGIAVVGGRDVVQIIDLTAAKPATLLGRIDRVAQANSVKVINGIAYIAAGTDGLQMYDVHTPSHPTWLANYVPLGFYNALLVEVSGNILYLGGLGQLAMIDISNPSVPRLRNIIQSAISDYGPTAQVVGNRLYINTPAITFEIYDISNKLAPKLLSSYDKVRDFRVVGTYAYTTSSRSTFDILDVSNATHPTIIKTLPLANELVRMTMNGGIVYAGDLSGTMIQSLDVSTPAQAHVVGNVAFNGFIYALQSAGSYSVIGTDQALTLMNTSIPAAPTIEGRISTETLVRDVAIDRQFLYVGLNSGLKIFWYMPSARATLGTAGGALNSVPDHTSYSFPAGSVNDGVTIIHTPRYQPNLPSTGALVGIDHAFDVSLVDSNSQPITPTLPFQLSVSYTDAERGTTIASTLALYEWDGNQWSKLNTSTFNSTTRTITATTTHTGWFAVLGETHRTFLPLSAR